MHGGKKAIAFGTVLKASSEGADYVLKLFEQCIRGPYIVGKIWHVYRTLCPTYHDAISLLFVTFS